MRRQGIEYSKVKRELARQGRTAAWLARQLGMHRSTLENIERGHYEPPQFYYERVAGILGVSLAAVKPEPEPVEVASGA